MALRLKSIDVNLSMLKGTWELDAKEAQAAWEIYVDMVTRIPIAPLDPSGGLVREALDSLYGLFLNCRETLKKYGPDVAKAKGKGSFSLAYISVWMLNGEIRPFLSRWHPLLEEYESLRAAGASRKSHDDAWPDRARFRSELHALGSSLTRYAEVFGEAAGVPSLIPNPGPEG